MPTDAQNATILELSADMIPHSGALVRQNFIFSAVSPLKPCHLSHEAQGKPCLYSILPGRGDISRGITMRTRLAATSAASPAGGAGGFSGNVANVEVLPVTNVANWSVDWYAKILYNVRR